MSVPSPFFDKFVYFFFAYYLSSLLLLTSSVFGRLTEQKETALSEAKTKVSHLCGLNYSLLSFKIYWHLPLYLMPEHRL